MATHEIQESILSTDEDSLISKPEPKLSVKGVAFGLMASALGTGLFNLPLRVTQIGILPFIVYVLLSAAFSIKGANMLAQLTINKGYESFSSVSEAAYGPALKRISQFSIIIFLWGFVVSFQVIMPKFAIELLADEFGLKLFSNRDEEIYNTKGNVVRIILNLCIIVSDFYLISRKDITVIQKFSMFGVFSVIFNVSVILIISFVGFHNKDLDLQYHGIFHLDWSKVRWIIFDGDQSLSKHAQAFATIIFLFVNHQLIFIYGKKLENPTCSRLKTGIRGANFGEMTLFLVVGMFGYLLFSEHLDVQPIGPLIITSIPLWITAFGRFMTIFALFFAIPLGLFPARSMILQVMEWEETRKRRYMICAGLAASTCITAMIFLHVNTYFGLLGGSAGVLMAGTIPAMCYYKLILCKDPELKLIPRTLELFFITIVTEIAFCGGLLSVIDPA